MWWLCFLFIDVTNTNPSFSSCPRKLIIWRLSIQIDCQWWLINPIKMCQAWVLGYNCNKLKCIQDDIKSILNFESTCHYWVRIFDLALSCMKKDRSKLTKHKWRRAYHWGVQKPSLILCFLTKVLHVLLFLPCNMPFA